MFRPLETDGVPAPSDVELEALAAWARHRRSPRGLDFNGATRALNINEDRQEFHGWCKRFINMGRTHSEDKWREHYQTFEAWVSYQRSTPNDDDKDQHDTQQDSLGTLW